MKKIVYDFDGTLTPYPVPRFKIILECGLTDTNEFLRLSKEKAIKENIDVYLAMYEIYFDTIRKAGKKLNNDNFALGSDNVVYNNGVLEFLESLQNDGVENYLLSSGLTVFLEKTIVANYFKKIFASTFFYDDTGEAIGVDFLMSDKNKVMAIKEIAGEDCSDVIYIGDGFTDYYAMEYVHNHGGKVIFVYLDENSKDMELMKDKGIVDLFTLADYSKDSELDKFIKGLCNIKLK